MNAHVLLKVLNKVRKRENTRFAEHFIFFGNKFNKINNRGVRMLDSIYHMTLKNLKSHFCR